MKHAKIGRINHNGQYHEPTKMNLRLGKVANYQRSRNLNGVAEGKTMTDQEVGQIIRDNGKRG
jgi:hypothetical protein